MSDELLELELALDCAPPDGFSVRLVLASTDPELSVGELTIVSRVLVPVAEAFFNVSKVTTPATFRDEETYTARLTTAHRNRLIVRRGTGAHKTIGSKTYYHAIIERDGALLRECAAINDCKT